MKLPKNAYYALIAILLLLISFFSGAKHDYIEYLKHWNHIQNGFDPWYDAMGIPIGNAYGPAYLLFAPLANLHLMLPKILQSIGIICIVYFIFMKELKVNDRFYFLSPFLLILCFYFSDVDVSLGVFTILAIYYGKKQGSWIYPVLSGLCLSFGVLLKFFPIVILPFLLWDPKAKKDKSYFREKFILGLTCGIAVIFGFLLSFYFWGESVLFPILFAGDRSPKILSIFRSLDGMYSPLKLMGISFHASRLSLPLMAITGLVTFYFYVKKQFSMNGGILLGLLSIFGWYKVGHHQFYIILFLCAMYWMSLEGEKKAIRELNIWLSVFSILFIWTGSFNYGIWEHVKEFLGYINFIIFLRLYVKVFSFENRSMKRV